MRALQNQMFIYFRHRVLGLTDSINETGNLKWELVVCSLCTWIVAFVVLIKGIKTSGKVGN